MRMNLSLFSTLLILLVGLASSDINQDKEECTEQLIVLANCLPYVSGQAKAPPIDCCTGVKEVVDKSKRCLCILIKDHDDPQLGIQINVTLALKLPTTCSSPTNISQCVDILHLSPKSPQAKIFEEFEKDLEKTNSTQPAPSVSGGVGNRTNTSIAQNKSGGGLRRRWPVTEMLFWILSLLFIFHFFFLV